ncbi:hypothetical protein A5906_05075 [Bradyrhizobium sacchari]|nr:hypothetical protein A5906_05075 [Bradyrhizobium sacchari]
MAIELSKAKGLVGMLTPLSDKISLRSIPCGAVQSLIEIIDRTLDKVLRATGQPARMVSCYEAGYDGFWLHRVLDAHGVTNHVIDAGSLLVSRKARRAKTGRLDAEKLVRVLMAFWRGEPKVCSVVQPPSIEEEDAKRQHREREFLEVFYRRFKNRRGLGSYLGLTPSPFQSGGMAIRERERLASNSRGCDSDISPRALWLDGSMSGRTA